MTHSYRNGGGNHSVAIPGGSNSTTNAKSGQAAQGSIYEKLRNSYQSPSGNKYNELNSTSGGVSASFVQTQKSPKISGHQGYKQIKVASIGGTSNTFSHSKSQTGYGNKNVKLMMVSSKFSKL